MITVKTFVFNSVGENTYVVSDDATRQAAIIDCGCMNVAEERALKDYITAAGLLPVLLLNTHMHFDHCWGNGFVERNWGLTPMTAREEVEEMPSPAKQIDAFGLSDELSDTKALYIAEGDRFLLGDTELCVLSVPGHSPGHLAFYIPAGSCVFTGDALFREEIGRCDLWGGSLPVLLASVRSRLLTLPCDTIVYSGHGPESTIGHEIKYNPYFVQ